jgi:hypothetical protein
MCLCKESRKSLGESEDFLENICMVRIFAVPLHSLRSKNEAFE